MSTLTAPAAVSTGTTTLFRFATAGSVDDGKSTLVGRLLHDSKAILADQFEQVRRTSAQRGFALGDGFDFALLTDGLRAEREQGITIDVAYRYFSTPARNFVLADCPGHVQYTRNMVTGATTADAVVVLVDARNGVSQQTRRHLAVVALLRVPHVIVAVNKIDIVDDAATVFSAVESDVRVVADSLGLTAVHVLPVSALHGDNIVDASERTPYYAGPTLLALLESLPSVVAQDETFRLPVQLVLRPQGGLAPQFADRIEDFRDYRAAAGRVSSGTVRVGDEVTVLPSGIVTTVTGIDVAGRAVSEARAPQSIALQLAADIDTARGTVITTRDATTPRREFTADLFQLDERGLASGSRVLIKHGTQTVPAIVDVTETYDLDDLDHTPSTALAANDIGRARIRVASDLALEPYARSREGGAFLVIDPGSGATLAAGTVTA